MKKFLTLEFVALVACLAIAGCAQPGQAPNLGNAVASVAYYTGGNIAINYWQTQLNQAYASGKINVAQFNALSNLATQARNDVNALAAGTAANTVTQAQVDAAVQAFTLPASQALVTFIPVVPVVQPVTTLPAK